MADGNLSMGQISHNNVTKGQHNTAPTLLMDGGVIDDGVMRVQSDNAGNQIITEYQDQMAVNYNANDVFTAQSNASLSNAKSNMASLTEKNSAITSMVDSETQDLARSFASGTASAQNVSISDSDAIRGAYSTTSSTSSNNSVADSQQTGTSSTVGLGVPIPGITASTSTNASNNQEIRSDMSKSEQQAYNTALEHVKTAAKTDSINSHSSEDMRLSKSLSSNLSKQEQIATEKARTQQDIDTYSEQLSYLESHSGTINRNMNDQILQEVIQLHPELHSKEQAAKWMRSHGVETDNIAKGVISNYNPFNSAENKAKIAEIEQNTPIVQIC